MRATRHSKRHRQAGVLERRWLPDIVPASAHDITIRGDKELQVLAGELFVTEKDFDRLVARLEPYSGEPLGADQRAKKIEGLEGEVYYQSICKACLKRFVSNGR